MKVGNFDKDRRSLSIKNHGLTKTFKSRDLRLWIRSNLRKSLWSAFISFELALIFQMGSSIIVSMLSEQGIIPFKIIFIRDRVQYW